MANGGIIGTVNNPTSSTATGVWQQEEQYEAVRDGTWPSRALFTTKSARFNSGSSDYLAKTFSSDGNRKKWTWSGWVKRSVLGTYQILFIAKSGSTYSAINFVDDQLRFFDYNGSFNSQLKTNRLFRDSSAWYHIVVAYDTTQGTAANRIKFYVNGVQETSFAISTYPSLNFDGYINESDYTHYIGTEAASGNYFDGYMSEVCFINDQQLAPTSFGVTNSDGVWTPIIYLGTYGNNGFNLQFEDAAALGTDSSPNGNTFTVNNLTSIDQSTDYPVVNFATLNPLNVPTSNAPTFSEGNLVSITSTATGSYKWGGSSTIGMTSGKFYCEAKATIDSTYSRNVIGITGDSSNLARTNGSILNATASCGYYSSNGSVAYNGSGDISGFNTSYTTGDIIGMALDLDNGKLYFSKNGTFLNSGNPTSGSTGTGAVSILASSTTPDGAYFFAQTDDTGTSSPSKFEFNFGSPPYAISSSNADGNGYGNFEYAVPSGYYTLNTANLAEFG